MVYVSATPGERELRHLCEVTGQAVPEGLLHVASKVEPALQTWPRKSGSSPSVRDAAKHRSPACMEIRPTGLLIQHRGPSDGRAGGRSVVEINARIERGERTWSPC